MSKRRSVITLRLTNFTIWAFKKLGMFRISRLVYNFYSKIQNRDTFKEYRKLIASHTDSIQIIVEVMDIKLSLDLTNFSNFMFKRALEREGLYEPEVTRFITENLGKGNVFMDIGANIGYYTLIALPIVGDRGRVIAIEPNPGVFERLKKNVAINNFENVELYNFALSDFRGQTLLNIPKLDDGTSSIVNDSGSNHIYVDVFTFDDYFSNSEIDIIKMDVEGAEIQILKSMRRYIANHKTLKIIIEWNRTYRSREDFSYLEKCFEVFLIEVNGDLHLSKVYSYFDIPFCNLLLMPK